MKAHFFIVKLRKNKFPYISGIPLICMKDINEIFVIKSEG
jgi:hypothetical protein